MFGGLCFKGDSLENDWYEHDPAWVEAQDSGEAFERVQEMLITGASYPMQDSECRDGLFDEDAIFLVFERDDLMKLISALDVAISLTNP